MRSHKNAIRTTSRVADAIILIFMLCVALLCLLPILNVLALSFSSSTAAARGPREALARGFHPVFL